MMQRMRFGFSRTFPLVLVAASHMACVGRIEDHTALDSGRRVITDDALVDRAVSDVTNADASASDTIFDGEEPDAQRDVMSTQDADSGPPLIERICEPWATPADLFDQSVVPVEVEPASPTAIKVVLVAGAASSGHPMGAHQFFAVTAVLAKMLCRVPGVVPVVVRNGWPTSTRVFDGAAAIVFYADGGDAHPLAAEARRALLRPHIARGVGFVNLHYAVEYNAQSASEARDWLGGVYEPGYSVNPLWRASFSAPPAHPSTSGVAAFEIDDEWYYNMRWRDDRSAVVELLRATPPDSTRTTPETMAHPGRAEVTAWAFTRPDGGRSFGFTGGHWFGNWLDSPETPHATTQRRVVTQGILWAAQVAIPSAGVDVRYAPSDAERFLDRR